jgi:amidase
VAGALRLARDIAAGNLSAREAVQACLDRIEARNGELNAVTVVLAEEGLAAADRGVAGPLAGVPFTVKENIDVAGTVTTYGVPGGTPAERDAPHVANLRAAGAIPVGRTNMPDLAMRWHTDNALHGATVNPFDATLSPGGSSGGDAVALAAEMCAFAVGSDFGGSLRVPAALAGVYALRPTPGRLAQAFAAPPSMSRQLMATDGPMATRFEDLEALLDVMARPGEDPRYVRGAVGQAAPRRVAVVLADDAVRRAADALSDAGHDVVEAEPAGIEEAAQLWLDLVGFEAGLGPLDQVVSEGTRRSATALFSLGRVTDGAGYAQALARRYALARGWDFPLVLGPVSTAPPWPVGHDQGGPDALRDEWWGFRLTVATACLGLPALSLPDGVQLVARWWDEARLMEVGRAAVSAGELDEQADAPA